jgi:hypothetical protein
MSHLSLPHVQLKFFENPPKTLKTLQIRAANQIWNCNLPPRGSARRRGGSVALRLPSWRAPAVLQPELAVRVAQHRSSISSAALGARPPASELDLVGRGGSTSPAPELKLAGQRAQPRRDPTGLSRAWSSKRKQSLLASAHACLLIAAPRRLVLRRRCFKLQFPLSTACLPSLRATTTIPIFSLSALFAWKITNVILINTS